MSTELSTLIAELRECSEQLDQPDHQFLTPSVVLCRKNSAVPNTSRIPLIIGPGILKVSRGCAGKVSVRLPTALKN